MSETLAVNVIIAVLGVSLGVFASHATLGNKVTRALTLLEELSRRVGTLEGDNVHVHRRKTDVA